MKIFSDDAWGIATVWAEARGEDFPGKLAVAEIIVNRTKSRYASDGTVGGTCLWPLQFSSWNSKDKNRLKAISIQSEDPMVADCIKAWEQAKAGSNTVQGALLYYSPKTLEAMRIPAPDWSDPAKSRQVASIGHHLFFVPLV